MRIGALLLPEHSPAPRGRCGCRCHASTPRCLFVRH